MIVGTYRPLIPPKLFLILRLSLNKNKISHKIENAEMLIFKILKINQLPMKFQQFFMSERHQ